MNEEVLRRLAEKRAARRSWIFRGCLLVLLAAQISASLYYSYRLHHRPQWANVVMTASAPQMELTTRTPEGIPNRLNINGEMWTVLRVKDFTDPQSAAEGSCHERVIWYLPAESRSELQNHVIHEVFHAGACLHGGDTWWNSINPDSIKHDGIYHLAEFWSGFARANPEFMEWISR